MLFFLFFFLFKFLTVLFLVFRLSSSSSLIPYSLIPFLPVLHHFPTIVKPVARPAVHHEWRLRDHVGRTECTVSGRVVTFNTAISPLEWSLCFSSPTRMPLKAPLGICYSTVCFAEVLHLLENNNIIALSQCYFP